MSGHREPSFNLLDEPWILVVTADGVPKEVSLTELFTRARELRMLGGDVPTQSFALLRLCLAVLHRALVDFTPTKPEAVPDAIEKLADRWDQHVAERVTQYLERHRERFFLFHPDVPFMQTPGLHTAKGEVSELAKIVVDVPNGSPYLTMRSARDLRSIGAAEAARWLVHTHAYDPSGIKTGVVGHPRFKGGRVYPEGVAWAGQLGGLHLLGDSVVTTLLLNLWAVLPESDEARATDLPSWERSPVTIGDLTRTGKEVVPARPVGPIDLYTWQPRCVLLHGDRDGVTGVVLTYADRFLVQERQNILQKSEPMTLWRYSKPQTQKYKQPIQMPRKHQPGSALWRGLANILPPSAARGPEDGWPTPVVDHAALLRGSTLLPEGLIRLRAIGVEYGSNESVVDEIVEDDLDLPASVLDPAHQELRTVAIDAVEAAQRGADALRNLARNLAAASGASGNSLDGPRARARDAAYGALDPLYRQWLRESLREHGSDPGAAVRAWHRTAYWCIRQLGEELIADAPDKAWKGFGASGSRPDVGKVDVWFRNALAKAFPLARLNDPATNDERFT